MRKTPFVGIFVAYCLGVLWATWLIAHATKIPWHEGLRLTAGVCGGCWVLLLFLLWKRRRIAAWLCLLSCFLLGTHLKLVREKSLQKAGAILQREDIQSYAGYLLDDPTSVSRGVSFLLHVERVYTASGTQKVGAKAKIRLYGKGTSLRYGDEIHVHGRPSPVAPPANPHAFDYRTYQKRKGILWQDTLADAQWHKTGRQRGYTFFRMSLFAKRRLLEALQNTLPPASLSLARGMLLGEKKGLPEETLAAFSAAGVMHLLAVSGLHVGFVYLFLRGLFSFIPHYRLLYPIKTLVFVACLWIFAIITGCSESVVRAVLMFSVVQLGSLLQRRTLPYNALGIAAMGLVLANPDSVFSISFQLSFVAVLGIVYLHPKLRARTGSFFRLLPRGDGKIARGMQDLLLVSLSAQISVLPLTLHYFHVFPTYFLLANLCLVPLLSLLIPCLLVLCGAYLAGMGGIVAILGTMVAHLTMFIERAVSFVESLPASRLYPWYLDTWEVVMAYALFVAGICCTGSAKVRWRVGLFFAGLWGVYSLYTHWEAWQREQIVLYHTPHHMAFEYLHAGRVYAMYEKGLPPRDVEKIISPHHIKAHYRSLFAHYQVRRTIRPDILQVVCLGGKTYAFLREGKMPHFTGPRLHVDYLVLFGRGSQHAALLPQLLAFDKVLIAPSNSPKQVDVLEALCEEKGWECHDVRKKGAFVENL